MRLKNLLITLLAASSCLAADAAQVQVKMNTYSQTMTLVNKATQQAVAAGEPTSYTYSFETSAGEYTLTGFNADGTVNNGSIDITVTDADDQLFTVLTCNAYVTNKTDNVTWTVDNGDYTLDVTVSTKDGGSQKAVIGESTTAGRNTFLVLKGNSYSAEFIPSAAHQAEGFMSLYKGATVTSNVSVSGAIPKGETYTVSVPAAAELQIGMKQSHFTDFKIVAPESVETAGDTKTCIYKLAYGQVYNYRTWMAGGLTQGGYFTMAEDASKRPALAFTEADYKAFDPKTVNHDVQSNMGYETGNIFVNINERGHLLMNVGDKYDALALRTWELSDNTVNNYFIEPDFHYTVVGLDGKPSTDIIEITQTSGSAWADIRAKGAGTAIVLVTYDAIGLNYYSGTAKTPYLGGEYWGAIWPENTGVYVVTVGQGATAITPNMVINEKYNSDTMKNAGKYVDAEHDVFYYLDTEAGATYTFTPDGVSDITIAYPTIGEQMATYTGFGAEGVTKNADGSYTLLLKEGRQIVRMTDASGKSVYQVLTAKKCHREIINASREGSTIFQPGDQVKIQYSGLHHPANKLAGIYNMSAYVTYNGVPNGSDLILGKGQYTFGSVASAQAVTVSLPEDLDVVSNPEFIMNEGVIQVNGYGDPIGNHRAINRATGRNANFTAIAHKTYFGYLPDVKIPLTAYKEFVIKVEGAPDGAEIVLNYKDKELTAEADGTYRGSYGTYNVTVSKAGYRCYRNSYIIAEGDEGERVFTVAMTAADVWDGKSMAEPQQVDGVYQIATPEELAWFADNVSVKGNANINGCLTADIDLGDYEWTTAIGTNAKPYKGTFDGQGYKVIGLYIDNKDKKVTYTGFFGKLTDAKVSGLIVYGQVASCGSIGGITGTAAGNTTIDRCANYCSVKAASYAGGIAAYVYATIEISNSYNAGDVDGNLAGGIAGMGVNGSKYTNTFNVGHITGKTRGSIAAASSATYTNCFATEEFERKGHEVVTDEQMRSGEIAHRLGEAFGQEIGKDAHPVLGGKPVYYDEINDKYTNEAPVETGIGDIAVDGAARAELYYNLQGVGAERPWQGLNIVKMSDGTTRKIYVK